MCGFYDYKFVEWPKWMLVCHFTHISFLAPCVAIVKKIYIWRSLHRHLEALAHTHHVYNFVQCRFRIMIKVSTIHERCNRFYRFNWLKHGASKNQCILHPNKFQLQEIRNLGVLRVPKVVLHKEWNLCIQYILAPYMISCEDLIDLEERSAW